MTIFRAVMDQIRIYLVAGTVRILLKMMGSMTLMFLSLMDIKLPRLNFIKRGLPEIY